MSSNVFGELLRKLRRDVDKSLVEFASILGCSVAYVSAVERGVKNPLGRDEIALLLRQIGRPEKIEELQAAAATSRQLVQIKVPAQADVAEMLVALARTCEEEKLDPDTVRRITKLLEEAKNAPIRPES